MDIEKEYDLSYIINVTQELVFAELGSRLETAERDGICTCQDCVLDMATLALNRLEPKYHSSLIGNIYTSVDKNSEYAVKVKTIVDFAIEKVKNHPSHS